MKTTDGCINWWRSDFPEALWPANNYDNYSDRCITGKHIMAHSKVMICGLARDCQNNLSYNIARIDRLRTFFDDSQVCVYENDSSDSTLYFLERWKDRGGVHIITETLGNKRHEQDHSEERTVDMAYYRNKYLDYAKTQEWDYLIVYDFDLGGGFSYHGICNSFGYNHWDVIGSNSLYYDNHEGRNRRLYYDTWAFRELGKEEHTNVNLNRYDRGDMPIKVNSCFGGLAIYRRETITPGFKYLSGDCDHPTIHRQMRQYGFDIYLNPSQITLYNEQGKR